MNYIGIDLGTSAVKLLLMNEKGEVLSSVSKEYPISFPKPGWSEQNPEDWYKAVVRGVRELVDMDDDSAGGCEEFAYSDLAQKVAGISFGGQMHGLVVLDENDDVIRPAILWNDGRTVKECEYLNEVIGKSKISDYTANIAFAGFTAPKILWMKENEPENFARIKKIMLPKDYIAYKLTGVFATDVSDASGMLLFDVKNRCWSQEMLDICGISKEQLANVYESYECIGTVIDDVADKLRLPFGVKVMAGAGDNAAAAVGTGTVGNGMCNISVGTSGTVFIAMDKFGVDENNALHSFDHADGGYHLMGCMLSAASCNKWWSEDILKTSDYAGEQAMIDTDKLGMNKVFYLPYLMGERSPHNDAFARATFTGISMDTERQDLTLAVLEGVAFGLRDSLEVARNLGITINKSNLCGGGAKSPLWRRILANVLDVELQIPEVEEGPAMGACMLAMVGCGAYENVEAAVNAIVKVKEVVKPEPELVGLYDQRYSEFSQIYPALKNVFKNII